MPRANMRSDGLHQQPAAAVTPDWPAEPNRKLLLHFEEDSPFVDDGDTGHTVTTVGAVAADALAAKWGTKGGRFTGGQLTIPDHADFQFGTDPWGVEFWAFADQLALDKMMFGMGSGVNDRFILYVGATISTFSAYWVQGGQGLQGLTKPGIFLVSTWHHVAFQKLTNGQGVVFLDGVPVMVGHFGGNFSFVGSLLRVGAQYSGQQWDGDMDELLIWTGERLEIRTYNVPTGPYS